MSRSVPGGIPPTDGSERRRSTVTLFEGDRASTHVLGFALMFALVVSTFAIYQADVVPHQNQQVEFEHNHEMADEMAALRGALQTTTTRGVSTTRSVEVGVTYPERAIAMNPPDPTGRLWTGSPEPMALHGLVSSAARYWDGSTRSFDTRLLRYRPSYNRFEGDRYGFEHEIAAKHYRNSGSRVLADDPAVIEGDRIDLALLGGEYNRHGKQTILEFRPVSSGTEWHRLTAQSVGGTNPYIELPTRLDRSDWETMTDGSPNISVASYTAPAGGSAGTVRLELTPGETYEVRLTKAAVSGPAATSAPAEYVTAESTVSPVAAPDTPATLTVTVRDRFGNPVAGEPVSFTTGDPDVDDAIAAVPATVTTDDEGHASITVAPSETVSGPITASVAGGGGHREVTFTLGTSSASSTSQMTVYTRGQMFKNVGGASSLVLKEGHMVPVNQESCLLVGDTGGGLVGGLLGSLQCDTDSVQTLQGTVTLDEPGDHRTAVRYYLLDYDGDKKFSGSDDDARVVLIDRNGDKIFEGELTNGAARRVLQSNGADLLEKSNYQTTYWEEPGLFPSWGKDDDYDSFDDVDISKTDSVFVDAAAGRVTLDLDE